MKKHDKPCCVCGCESDIRLFKDGNIYCGKHYQQMKRHGKIMNKTVFDKNDYIFEDDIVKIVLRNRYQNILGYCVIDADKYDLVNQYKWYLSGGYCVTKGINRNKGIRLHHLLMNSDELCDHIDNDKLNNRMVNLRKATHQENSINKSLSSNNKTGVVGICQKWNKWVVNLTYNYQDMKIGSYNTFDEAVINRLKGEAIYFKEFSNNYNPSTNTIRKDVNGKLFEVDLNGNILSA
jgi:hypothetical protein